MCAAGRVELIIGPMFAGKTTELMRRVRREMHARRNCFIIKYANDVRYDQDNVASHDKITLRACAAVRALREVGTQWRDYDVIAIDEGQFFDDLITFARTAADAGKTVLVSALDGDYLCRPFGRICELVPHCESVTKLTAVCMMCHNRQASFTRRTVESQERELIGGAEMYIATCRECFNMPGQLSSAVVRHVHETMRQVERVCLAPYLRAPAAATTATSPAHEQHHAHGSNSDEDVHTPCNSLDSDGCKTPTECAAAATTTTTAAAAVTYDNDDDKENDSNNSTTCTGEARDGGVCTADDCASTTTSPSSEMAAATTTSTASSAEKAAGASGATATTTTTPAGATVGAKRAREDSCGGEEAATLPLSQAQRVLTQGDY